MPKSKSKRTARAVSFAGLPPHPAIGSPDPLLEYRMGASMPLRLPDAENSPSAATILRSEYTIGSDAAGHALFAEVYNISNSKYSWTVTAGVAGTGIGVAHPQYTAFLAEARVARMVAMRVQVLYIGAEQESAGYLSYSEKINVTDIDAASMDALHTGSDIQVPAKDGLVSYVDYTQVPRWEVPGSSTFSYATFPIAVFAASGLPASKTSLFRVRVERFMEYLPVEGALAEGELRHEPSNPGALSSHGALSGPATSVHKPGEGAQFVQKVKAVANAAYHMAQPLLPYVVPKAREFLASALLRAAPLALAM